MELSVSSASALSQLWKCHIENCLLYSMVKRTMNRLPDIHSGRCLISLSHFTLLSRRSDSRECMNNREKRGGLIGATVAAKLIYSVCVIWSWSNRCGSFCWYSLPRAVLRAGNRGVMRRLQGNEQTIGSCTVTSNNCILCGWNSSKNVAIHDHFD